MGPWQVPSYSTYLRRQCSFRMLLDNRKDFRRKSAATKVSWTLLPAFLDRVESDATIWYGAVSRFACHRGDPGVPPSISSTVSD